jgi:hypothetical protein
MLAIAVPADPATQPDDASEFAYQPFKKIRQRIYKMGVPSPRLHLKMGVARKKPQPASPGLRLFIALTGNEPT